MSSLLPGEFGWQRTASLEGARSVGRVLCFLLPGAGSNREAANSPIPGIDRPSYSHLEILSGPPWRIVAAMTTTGAVDPLLRKFSEAVARELRPE